MSDECDATLVDLSGVWFCIRPAGHRGQHANQLDLTDAAAVWFP